MDAAKVTRVGILLFIYLQIICGFEIPPVKLEAFKPKGLRASIPDVTGNGLFVFQGHLNRAISNGQVGSLMGEIIHAKDGAWTYEDSNVELKVGDIVHYYVVVVNNKIGYIRDKQEFKVTELKDRSSLPSPPSPSPPSPSPPSPSPAPTTSPRAPTQPTAQCVPSITSVRGKLGVCSGDVILEDNFDTLKEDKWQVHQYIPLEDYGYPFVSYQLSSVSVKDGNLRITPKLQQSEPGYSNESIYMGHLDLSYGCTTIDTCSLESSGWNILPPVVSGKVTTKDFAFTYGVVEIRAKLPLGDWLYPEILLDSLIKKYGRKNHVSGFMKIAAARGNKALSNGCSNAVLYGGLIATSKCSDVIKYTKTLTAFPFFWGEDFHVYSLEWRPDMIIFKINGEEWGRAEGRIREKFDPSCGLPYMGKGIPDLAPFDQHFILSLSLAAGGTEEFPDGITSANARPKPWRNSGVKAKLDFWNDLHNWIKTWDDPALLIDYVKVTAL